MPKTLRDLRREIDRYIRNQPREQGLGPLVMQDLHKRALECQARIEALGFQWDRERMLWKAPTDGKRRQR